MEIDATLDEILLPALPTYQNEFGTKKADGGLSTAECADFIMRPFRKQRPFTVSEDSETTEIQFNCGFVVTTAGVTLTLADAAFSGCEATVVNLSDGSITVKGGVSGLNGGTGGIFMAKGACIQFVFYNGWRSLVGGNGQGHVAVPVAETLEDVSDTTEFVVRDSSEGLIKAVDKKQLFLIAHPVGSLYWSSNPTSPQKLYGGTWEQIKDRFVWAKGDADEENATGGTKTNTLTVGNLPSHTHGFTPKGTVSVTGGNHTHGIGLSGGDPSNIEGGLENRNRTSTKKYTDYSGNLSFSTSFTGTAGTTTATGSGSEIDNMPPYVVKYCWERIA